MHGMKDVKLVLVLEELSWGFQVFTKPVHDLACVGYCTRADQLNL